MTLNYNVIAKEFMRKCNATMEITLIGKERNPDWGDDYYRNKYHFVLTTPYGTLTDDFWDNVYNTNKGTFPTTYDILACLEKYDVGTIDDFVTEFGYEVKKWDDVKRIENTYTAVVLQYNKLCEIFTPEQMEMLRKID